MAKLNRESRLRDKRAAKEARKVARQQAPAEGSEPEQVDDTYFGPLAEDRRPA
jgi:hypothetical protein